MKRRKRDTLGEAKNRAKLEKRFGKKPGQIQWFSRLHELRKKKHRRR